MERQEREISGSKVGGRMMKRVIEIAEVLVGVPVLIALIAGSMVAALFRDTSIG
jgi:hypothetical protein